MIDNNFSRRNFIKTAAGAAAAAGVGVGPLVQAAHASPGPDTRFSLLDSIYTISKNVTMADPNERLQSACFGASGKLFTLQQPAGGGPHGNLVLSRLQWNSASDTIGDHQASYGRMNLNGFGHGQQFGVVWDGTDHWIYMECHSGDVATGDAFGSAICKFKWVEGGSGTYNYISGPLPPGFVLYNGLQPAVNTSSHSCMIDTLTNKLVLRFHQDQGTPIGGTVYSGSAIGWNFAIYDLATLTNSSVPISPCFRGVGAAKYTDQNGVTQTTSPPQGACIMENVIYEIQGTGWPGACGPSPAGSTGNVCISSFDIRTGACYASYITGDLSLNIREPEGCWIQRTGGSTNTQRLMFTLSSAPTCPVSGQTGPKRANFYVKRTLTDVPLQGCTTTSAPWS